MRTKKIKQKLRCMGATALRDWDRVLYSLILIGFGVYSFINPVLSVRKALPLTIVENLFNAEFVVAGLALLVGTLLNRPKLQGLGHLVSALGMATVGSVIVLISGTKGLSYGLLLYAGMAREIGQYRRSKKTVHLGEEEIREIVSKEMAQVLTDRTPEGTGHD